MRAKWFLVVALLLTSCATVDQEIVPPPEAPKVPVQQEQPQKNDTQVIPTNGNAQQNIVSLVKVIDGDTIEVTIDGTDEKVRIIGIDSPERGECYFSNSSKALSDLIGNGSIQLVEGDKDDRDVYGRLLRYVHVGSKDIGLEMVKSGYAISYRKYPHMRLGVYDAVETTAKSSQIGLWGDACNTAQKAPVIPTVPVVEPSPPPPVPVVVPALVPTPAPVAPAPTECLIKGNISSSGEKIYHVSGCQSYNKTKIDTSKGERWFCTESEALAAGWRKALNCP